MNPFKKRHIQYKSVILDTCALIDGRIVDIARAGFVPSHLIIPQFVIAELQFLADKGDSYKRERARFGLDVARHLQSLDSTFVEISRQDFPKIKEVDDKLILLAKELHSMLYTTDYNLNKVAQIEGVTVLNVNELAQALRPHRLPGEQIEIKLTQTGQDKTQGVGHLDDGTMVVVEKAAKQVGKKVKVKLSRVLQTQAGKMMFAVLLEPSQVKKQPNRTIKNVRNINKKPQTQRPSKVQKQQQKNHPTSSRTNPNPRRKKRITPEDRLMDTLSRQ